MDRTEDIAFHATDGYPLRAKRYAPPGRRIGRLIVAGATAVPQGFYARFAATAAARGHEVWTLDYRGVGLSAPPSLRGFRMSYLDWAQLDLAALVDLVAARGVAARGDAPLRVVGHSHGGHALGLGEGLPRDVFYQWRRWCGSPRYFFEDPALPDLAARFAAVRTPIRAVNAVDDKWAMPASRDAFMAAYSGAPVEHITLEPRTLGLREIGHMGCFRPRAAALWDDALDWLEAG